MSTVLQPWVEQMGWKMQSILLSGFRGPDVANVPHIKAVNRWLRRVSQNNADPSKDYMREDPMPDAYEVCDELEFLSAHYVHHFADSLRVVSLYHPDAQARSYSWGLHYRIAEEVFHFTPEEDSTFRIRHMDKTHEERKNRC